MITQLEVIAYVTIKKTKVLQSNKLQTDKQTVEVHIENNPSTNLKFTEILFSERDGKVKPKR